MFTSIELIIAKRQKKDFKLTAELARSGKEKSYPVP